jgi:hypothetical protein
MRHHIPSTILLFVTCWAIWIIPSPCLAQITFERTYGGRVDDFGRSVQETQDGGYIITGTTSSFGASPPDVYLIEADSLGDTLWTRTYGGVRGDYGYSVQQTQDGGYIVAGGTYSFGAGYYDVYLVKVDSSGDTLWTRTYGGSDYDIGYSVRQTQDGGYIITGMTRSFGAQDQVLLVKVDSLGDTTWIRTFGGDQDDRGNSVRQTQDGGYIVAGTSNSFGSGQSQVYLVRTDSLGDTLWTRAAGGIAGYSVELDSDGTYTAVGLASSLYDSDVYLIKLDSLGEILWANSCGGTKDDGGYSIQQTQDGGYIIAGGTYSYFGDSCDVYLVRTDSLGDTLWTRTYGGVFWDEGNSVWEDRDGGYVVAGYTSSFGAGGFDFYLIKTDEDGLTGVNELSSRAKVPVSDVCLLQNSPNPFTHSTVVSYSLPSMSKVTLTIYDITGRLVETLVNETEQPGIHQVSWDRKDSPSGVYFYRLKACPERSGELVEPQSRRAGEFTETRKMVILE